MPERKGKKPDSASEASIRSRLRGDMKGLWAITWRAVLFGPIVVPLGYAALILAFASLLLPPIYVITCFVGGDILLGVAVGIAYALWLRYGGMLLQPVFENWRDDD
jgi:hypothetical protein